MGRSTYCYHYDFRVHLSLSGADGAKRVPFHSSDQEEEPNNIGSLPAINTMRHALKNDLGDERERHAGPREGDSSCSR